MNSLERVKAAIHFKNPDRVPIYDIIRGDFLPLPITESDKWRPGWSEYERDLFPHTSFLYEWNKPPWALQNPEFEGNKWRKIKHEEVDEWGCIWNMSGREDNMGHPGRAVLPDWEGYEEYISRYNPNLEDQSRYSNALKIKDHINKELYRVASCSFGIFERASKIRGFTNCLIDHKRHPRELKILLEHLTEQHIKIMNTSFKYGLEPHGFIIAEDLGSQSGPFISPQTFKKVYGPHYKRIFEEAHDLGCEFHMHSCGKMDPLIPSLIEWGLDSIEFDSPRMCGYKHLNKFRGKILMWGCINIQSIYPNGTPEECEREVWHMIRNLGTKKGGFGAYFYSSPDVIHVPRKNINAYKRGLKKFGVYSKIPAHWWDCPLVDEWKDDVVPPLPPN